MLSRHMQVFANNGQTSLSNGVIAEMRIAEQLEYQKVAVFGEG